jgi:hypothetical protein
LQEGATQLQGYGQDNQVFPFTNSHRLLMPSPGLVWFPNARGKAAVDSASLLLQHGTWHSLEGGEGSRGSGSHAGSCPHKNTVSFSLVGQAVGLLTESTQLLERLGKRVS